MLKAISDAFCRSLSIKTYVALWCGSVMVSCVVLACAGYVGQARLDRMTSRIFTDAKGVGAGRLVQSALLAERRQGLLWRATHDPKHRAQRDADLAEAEQVARTLHAYATSDHEKRLVHDLLAKLSVFRSQSIADPPPPIKEVSAMADELLGAADAYLDQNRLQMDETAAHAQRLHAAVDRWLIRLVSFVVVLLVLGSMGLISRIVRPALDLSDVAAAFGGGDLAARATVIRDDELGSVARTFNSMAEDIANREAARLEFVATVVHDLKNPLVTIGGAARMLRQGTLPLDRQARWLDRIIGQVTRMEHLALDLMDTVQVETGRLSLNTVPLDLAELVQAIHCVETESCATDRLALEAVGECQVLGDRSRLERVVHNLISNAVKYSLPEAAIHLRIERRGDEALLAVQDQGVGIPAEDLEAIFQPFGRARHTQAMAAGTGLGLCVVKAIIEAHEGRVAVLSEVGVGTVVEVWLPLLLDDSPEELRSAEAS